MKKKFIIQAKPESELDKALHELQKTSERAVKLFEGMFKQNLN